MSGTKKTHILKTECMIGNRTFPTRNKTQIIKKNQTIADEFAFYCISYVFIVFIMKRWRVWSHNKIKINNWSSIEGMLKNEPK